MCSKDRGCQCGTTNKANVLYQELLDNDYMLAAIECCQGGVEYVLYRYSLLGGFTQVARGTKETVMARYRSA